MKLFFDKALTEPVTKFEFPRTDLGDDAFIDFYIHNASEKWPIIITPETETHAEIKLLNIPQRLAPLKTSKCKIQWTPSLSSDDPLITTTPLSSELQIG